MQSVQFTKQVSRPDFEITLSQPQVHFIDKYRHLTRGGIGPGCIKLVVQACQKGGCIPLWHQAGEQLLILPGTQIQPQLILESFE